jgi:signal transduction histidine kinase
MKGFFSIRTKFLGVMSALLVCCLVVYLLIAVSVFKTDKTELVYDLNRSMVSNLAAEIETEFKGVSDKFRLFATLSTNSATKNYADQVFGENSPVVFATLYRQEQNLAIKTYSDKKYSETYGLEEEFFSETLLSARPIPFNEILKNGEYFWNASIDGGTPLIGYGRNVVIEDSKGIPTDHLAVVGYIQPDKILKILNVVKMSDVAIVDHSGQILVHSNFDWMKQVKNLSDRALFQKAKDAKVNLSVAATQDEGKEFLGAFAKTYQGQIIVLSKISKDHAFSAVTELVSRSLSFAMIVITVSLLFAFLLSRSLTESISILVSGMEKVSNGDLSSEIHVNTRDETRMLATSFNQMISELKQSRDELQEINRELDQKVKDRTLQLEIQNSAVKEAQEALLKTTRLASAGEIAGRAAHEVLNPLTGILARLSGVEKRVQNQVKPQLNLMKDIFSAWNTDHNTGGFEALAVNWKKPSQVNQAWTLWQEDMHNLTSVQDAFTQLTENIEADTHFLINESRRIGKIVDGMRKLSRLNSDVKTYSARQLMIDSKNIMADLFTQHNIDVIESYSAGYDEVSIDRDEFIQAMTNLMRNSLQAMLNKEHKYVLKIATELTDTNIVLSITDNGSGISKDHQHLLFDKQFTTKSAEEGTGLGLGISRRFIRAHGGDITFVTSHPYKETTFKILLPIQIKKQLDTPETKEGAA